VIVCSRWRWESGRRRDLQRGQRVSWRVPFPEPERIVSLETIVYPTRKRQRWTTPACSMRFLSDFFDWRQESKTFEAVASVAYGTTRKFTPDGNEMPRLMDAEYVLDFFRVLISARSRLLVDWHIYDIFFRRRRSFYYICKPGPEKRHLGSLTDGGLRGSGRWLVVCITHERLNSGAASQLSVIQMNVFAALTPFSTRTAHTWPTVIRP